jgi:hypothetical protein
MTSFPSLLGLPVELQEALTDDLPSLKSLRGTCRSLELLATPKVFEIVAFVLSLKSLRNLRNIALHPRIAGHVRELEFSGGRLDYFSSRAEWESAIHQRLLQGFNPRNDYGTQEMAAGWRNYQKLLAEQKVIHSLRVFRFKAYNF